MTQSGLGRSLEPILTAAPEIDDDRRSARHGPPMNVPMNVVEAGGGNRGGLELAYEALSRLVTARGLRDAVVVVDDPDLGRQLLFAGRRPATNGDDACLEGDPGCYVEPPGDDDGIDLVLAHGLCTSALRVALLDDAPVRPIDGLEMALRRLPGVYAVAVDEEDPVVQLHATAEAEPDLARRAGGLARAHLNDLVTVEVVRRSAPPVALVAPVPEPADQPSDRPASPAPELVAVLTIMETNELEVHLRHRGVRTIGRAALASGPTGAVEATLGALSEAAGTESSLSVSWVRTIETTTDGRFVVATGLQDGLTLASRYGIAAGASPMEAAVRATLDAIAAPDDVPPTVHWASGAGDPPE